MIIQYVYALVTMLPCPLWFWYRWASAAFLMAIFTWATYNGATFYIDVFGKKMEKELEAMRKEVAKWQNTPDGRIIADTASGGETPNVKGEHSRRSSLDGIPLLDQKSQNPSEGETKASSTAVENNGTNEDNEVRQRS